MTLVFILCAACIGHVYGNTIIFGGAAFVRWLITRDLERNEVPTLFNENFTFVTVLVSAFLGAIFIFNAFWQLMEPMHLFGPTATDQNHLRVVLYASFGMGFVVGVFVRRVGQWLQAKSKRPRRG
ncbi:MAG TPA: hypothetical protein VFB22_03215 [Candidatus Baltobacteraceae bacterium]|nr:hypothetical protein [Candidatus Baltobacteraceae bacterium]